MNKEIQVLDWDSKHFGQKIATLQSASVSENSLRRAIAESKSSFVDCLYCLLPISEIQKASILEALGFNLVDVRATFSKDLRSSARIHAEKPIFANPEDHAALVKLSESSFADSRFFNDPRFDRKRANQMYVEWIQKNLKGELPVFVSKTDRKIEGFMSVEKKGTLGKLSLMAVDENVRGKGIGRKLVETAMEYLRDAGCETCEVVTQAQNISAVKTYEKCGFTTKRLDLWFHKWFTQEMRAAA